MAVELGCQVPDLLFPTRSTSAAAVSSPTSCLAQSSQKLCLTLSCPRPRPSTQTQSTPCAGAQPRSWWPQE